jgi:MFS family permease
MPNTKYGSIEEVSPADGSINSVSKGAASSTAYAELCAPQTDAEIKRFIEKNSLVWRFCMYGAIKNLQFFEAYLMVILLAWGYDLYQIGWLNAIVYTTTYLMEVPAGIIADHFGKKKELLACFVFYIISFAFYFVGERGFPYLVAASIFYGFGEAFRSGSHKAMIMRWLDEHELIKYKTFIYSRTRSFSNLGSSLNAVLSVVFIVYLGDNYAFLFAISILPFLADFLLVATYPSYMNETPDTKKNCSAIMGDTFRALVLVFKKGETRRPLLSSSSFMALYTQLKHYIQPIMVVYGGKMLTRWDVSFRPALSRPPLPRIDTS